MPKKNTVTLFPEDVLISRRENEAGLAYFQITFNCDGIPFRKRFNSPGELGMLSLRQATDCAFFTFSQGAKVPSKGTFDLSR